LEAEEPFLPEGPLRVGITSGASTPDRVVEDVIHKLMDLADS
jgi:4-hydroxy-3-methylbut-2-enyl diphosphate reductase